MRTAALLIVMAVCAPAEAADSCPARAAALAQSLYAALDFVAASQAVADVEACLDGSPREFAEAIRWRAQALVAAGEEAAATEAFLLLETVRPDFPLDPMLSPRIHAVHQAGRAQAEQQGAVFARLTVPSSGEHGTRLVAQVFNPFGRRLEVQLTLEDQGRTERLVATPLDEGRWETSVPPDRGGFVRVVLTESGRPAFTSGPARVERVVNPPADAPTVAPEPDLKPTLEATASEQPRHVEVIAGAEEPPYLLYAGIGAAVVIAASAAIFFLVRPQPVSGSLGNIELPAR